MRRAVNIVLVVLCGVVGAWIGYWIGHAAGWSENAVWPATIGGGTGAILLSMSTSILFVLIAATFVFLVPNRGARQALRGGAPAQATMLSIAETGALTTTTGETRRQVSCELEVILGDGATYRARTTQFLDETFERSLRPGAAVAVCIDPAEPRRVAIVEPGTHAA